jgi:hypothetical protein
VITNKTLNGQSINQSGFAAFEITDANDKVFNGAVNQ